MAECTHIFVTAVFLLFCFVLSGSKFFLCLYNFPDTHTILMITSPNITPHVDTPPVCHAKHGTYMTFPLRNICVLFTLGNKWTSSYATHCIFTGAPSCLSKDTGAHLVMPSAQFLQHVKGIFLSQSNTIISLGGHIVIKNKNTKSEY